MTTKKLAWGLLLLFELFFWSYVMFLFDQNSLDENISFPVRITILVHYLIFVFALCLIITDLVRTDNVPVYIKVIPKDTSPSIDEQIAEVHDKMRKCKTDEEYWACHDELDRLEHLKYKSK